MKKHIKKLVIIPILIIINFIYVGANEFEVANNIVELKNIMAKNIASDNYDFTIIYNSSDTPFYTATGLTKLFGDASILAGPYYEHQQRESSIRVSKVGTKTALSFKMNYETSLEQIKEINEYVKKEADKILLVTKEKHEVIKKINDLLKETVSYGYSKSGVNTNYAFSAYGVVKESVAMNMGYAFIIERFMNYLNYESDIVYGMIDGKSDYWNLIKLDGKWYHLDVAYNDKTNSADYLLKSDSFMSKNRTWDYGRYEKANTSYDFSIKQPLEVTPPIEIKPPVETVPPIDNFTSKLKAGFHEYVYTAEKRGLLTDEFMKKDLKKEITREEFVEIIIAVYESFNTNEPVYNKRFEDTNNSKIIKAYELGLIKGVSSTKFGPNSFLTREQSCVILLQLIKLLNGSTYYESVSISDEEEISFWALEAMNYMVYNKIVAGVGGGRVAPKGTLLREHAVILAVRVQDILNN